MTKKTLNLTGLKCPMPILEVSKTFKEMKSLEEIEVTASDPIFLEDIKAWCKKTNNELIQSKIENTITTVVLKKI